MLLVRLSPTSITQYKMTKIVTILMSGIIFVVTQEVRIRQVFFRKNKLTSLTNHMIIVSGSLTILTRMASHTRSLRLAM
jgi:hypothetical protein